MNTSRPRSPNPSITDDAWEALESLGAWREDHGVFLWAPESSPALARGLSVLAHAHTRVHLDDTPSPDAPSVGLDLSRLASVELDAPAGVVRVGAGATLASVDAVLSARGLTLGWLPPLPSHAPMAAWWIGHRRGRRWEPNGRWVASVLSLEVALRDGARGRVDTLDPWSMETSTLLGSGLELGVPLGATLAVVPRDIEMATVAVDVSDWSDACERLRGWSMDGVPPVEATWDVADGQLHCRFAGRSARTRARRLHSPAGHAPVGPPSRPGARPDTWHLWTWDALASAAPAGTVWWFGPTPHDVLVSAEGIGPPTGDRKPERASWAAQVLGQLDPRWNRFPSG